MPGSHTPATWHGSRAVQTFGFAPVQVPFWQVSVCVHAFESLHAVPLAFVGFEHTPVPGSHTPATWHASDAAHTTGVPGTQAPDWHVSLTVHALLSVQAVPFAFAGLEHRPVALLHTPASWHWSEAEHWVSYSP